METRNQDVTIQNITKEIFIASIIKNIGVFITNLVSIIANLVSIIANLAGIASALVHIVSNKIMTVHLNVKSERIIRKIETDMELHTAIIEIIEKSKRNKS